MERRADFGFNLILILVSFQAFSVLVSLSPVSGRDDRMFHNLLARRRCWKENISRERETEREERGRETRLQIKSRNRADAERS